MRRSWFFLNGAPPEPEPNTFIGGVGASYITSAADLAALTSLSEGDIQNFQIDGINVSCYIGNSYNFNIAAFLNNNNITWYIDVDGFVSNVNVQDLFENSTSLKYIYIPNAVNVGSASGQRGFNNMENLVKLNIDSCNGTFGNETLEGSNIKKLYLNSTNLNNGGNYPALNNLTFAERVYMANVTTISFFSYTIERFFSNIKNGCKVYYNSTLGVANRNAYVRGVFNASVGGVGETMTVNGLTYTGVTGAPTTDGEFRNDAGAGNQNVRAANLAAAINADTRTGTLDKVVAESFGTSMSFRTQTLLGAAGNAITITAGTVMTSVSSGTFLRGNDVHPLYASLRDFEGCVLVECTSPISVNTPTSLSASNQTTTSVDLNFTAPTANANGTDAYEVWVDDGTVYRKLFEYDEITASGDTLDLTEVYNDVGTISGVKIKIRTIDGQMNFSDFSNEITLP